MLDSRERERTGRAGRSARAVGETLAVAPAGAARAAKERNPNLGPGCSLLAEAPGPRAKERWLGRGFVRAVD